MGICPVVWDTTLNRYTGQPFNFYVNPIVNGGLLRIDRVFSCTSDGEFPLLSLQSLYISVFIFHSTALPSLLPLAHHHSPPEEKQHTPILFS